MSPIVTTARIVCKDKESRVKALSAFHKIIEFSEPHEPGVLRYVVTLPVDDTTGTVLYMIEEYASQAASDSHLATQPVQDLIGLFTTGDVLAGAPDVHTAPIVANKLAKQPPSVSDNPAIVLANFEYKPGTLASALKGWNSVVDYVSAKEEGTKSYTIFADLEKGNEIRTVEVYDSWEFVENVHLKSPAIAQNVEQNGKDRTGVKGAVKVKFVDGFLGREKLGKL
ncbi:hypothetical protein K505DRAFT_379873 [Melanomma pulvis-pyrius CBS 109.77]|uniref:ABM domain-containing protein n=1 Tax=Melanomma pulvis-pyrius CBS 109.77 TaxID=1314802 RepID=A0A6A6WSV4_9PLEO|nr:hypothetical protein K505DRAFT_379873 [Melanomma pulvis-pyrius CBS 109.77]